MAKAEIQLFNLSGYAKTIRVSNVVKSIHPKSRVFGKVETVSRLVSDVKTLILTRLSGTLEAEPLPFVFCIFHTKLQKNSQKK